MARPRLYDNDQFYCIRARRGAPKLQKLTDRRAVLELMLENRGRMTIDQINKHFNIDMRTVVLQLVRVGWLEAE